MYRVAGTVGLASTAVMGISDSYKGPLEPVYRAALSLGIANQLTNVLRDVGEDIDDRDRIYLPTDELERFNISEKEVCSLTQQGAHSIEICYLQFTPSGTRVVSPMSLES